MTKPLKIVKPKVDRGTVTTLKGLIKDARQGEIVGIAYAAVNRQGDALWGWVGDISKRKVSFIGAITILKEQVLRNEL